MIWYDMISWYDIMWLYDNHWFEWSMEDKKMLMFQRKYGWWKKIMGLGRIMEDKIIISVRRIMEDSINKKNDGISKELWMIKKIMGLEWIMEDEKIISVIRIMEDLVNKKKWWYFKGIMDDEKKDGFETNYGR